MYRDDYREDYDNRSYDQSHSAYPSTRDPYFDDQPPLSRERERGYGFDTQDHHRSSYDPQDNRSSYDPQDNHRSTYDRSDRHRSTYDASDGGRRSGSYRLTPPTDDPYYRRTEVPLPQTIHSPLDVEPGFAPYGSVMLCLPSSFEPRPKKREKPPNCDTVFVGSLPDNMQEKHLQDLFMDCGRIAGVRLSRGRNFGHVQFASVEAVDKAVEMSGARVKIGSAPGDTGKIYVDYAHPKGESEGQKKLQDGELMSFNAQNATLVSSDLHRDDSFANAAKNVIHWLERGNCNQATSNTFFGLVTTIHSHARKLGKSMKTRQEEFEEEVKKKKVYMESLAKECRTVEELFSAATQQKAWDHFTKPQRKYISQWKDHVMDVSKEIAASIQGSEVKREKAEEFGEPATKKPRSDPSVESELAVARKEIEYLKSESEEALEKKEKQILQLKTLLAHFKQAYPDEWEKAIGLKSTKGEAKDRRGSKKPQSQEEVESDAKTDVIVIDGVSLDDLAVAMHDGGEGDNSLAAAAAAYAKMRTTVIGTAQPTPSGLDLTEAEVAMVSVLATFLTVHPLGATIGEITQYFQTFNPVCNSYFLESLLHRLPQVFQLSQSSVGEAKWWFLGFQTCCSQAQQHSQLHYTSSDTVHSGPAPTPTTTITTTALL
eukprot:Em0021g665a